MKLIVLDGELAVARLGEADPIPDWAAQGVVWSVTRTAEELSVVCGAAAIPPNVQAERGWRALRVAGRLDFSLTGVLASLAAPLAAGRVSIFAVSTYDTDHILVRSHALAAALDCLRAAGHQVWKPERLEVVARAMLRCQIPTAEEKMVLTKPELIASLQNEVRILLHLAGKIDPTMLDYRPTPKQRSTIELLRYLSMMGPTVVQYAIANSSDPALWTAAAQAADRRDFDQAVAAIASHADTYAALLADLSDADLRAAVTGVDGGKTSRGALIVNMVLGGCIAYRTQLFLYLKSCGREELGTMNLWAGVDAPAAAV